MEVKITKDFILAALTRALKTFAQTALGMFTVGMAMSEVNWLYIFSVAGTAAIYSVLTSIVAGLPEMRYDGSIALLDPASESFEMQFQSDEQASSLINNIMAGKQSRVTLKVTDGEPVEEDIDGPQD